MGGLRPGWTAIDDVWLDALLLDKFWRFAILACLANTEEAALRLAPLWTSRLALFFPGTHLSSSWRLKLGIGH